MDDIKIENVHDGLDTHLAKVDPAAKKELQAKQAELKAQIAKMDVSAGEQLRGIRDEATAQIAKFSDDIDLLDGMIFNLENLVNDAADIIADKEDLTEKAQEVYKKRLHRCRKAVGRLIWLQHIFKRELYRAADNRSAANSELQKMQEFFKERRRLQRALAMTELKLNRIKQVEADSSKKKILH